MKQIIAVDIDDVLADNAQGFIAFSNRRWGTHLTIDDYDDHWGQMWQIDDDEVEHRALEYHSSGEIGNYKHKPEALPVLQNLARNDTLIVVTARSPRQEAATRKWLDNVYAGLFEEIYFTSKLSEETYRTKGEICADVGASWLIDDYPGHCKDAVDHSVTAILYGEYGWHQHIPEGVVHCKDWKAIGKYFDKERSR